MQTELQQWLAAQTWSSFAQSLASQRKPLTPKQIAAAESMRHKCELRNAERAAKMKTQKPIADIDAGRYAIKHNGEVRCYKVDKPKDGYWAGKTFAKVLENRSWVRLSRDEVADVVEAIAADPLTASVLYGKHTGSCGRCGRTLTDPDSVAAGIGPICASRF